MNTRTASALLPSAPDPLLEAAVLNAYARTLTDRIVDPIARGLVRIGVTPNWLTFAGLLVTLVGVAVVLTGRPISGATVMAAGLVFDAFDGAVARHRGTAGRFGAFYDSIADRIADGAVFGMLLWLVAPDPLGFAVALVAMVTAQLTPYVRAKAEALGWQATVGLLERAERLVIVLIGLWFGVVDLALWVLAIGGTITVTQRLVAVWRQAGRPGLTRRSASP